MQPYGLPTKDPVVVLVGEFDLSNADDVRNALTAVATRDGRRIVVNLSETTFLDSTVLGVLARASQENEVWVRGANGVPRKALEITGLLKYMHDDDTDSQDPPAA